MSFIDSFVPPMKPTEEERVGNSISYREAVRRPPKPNKCWLTAVNWQGCVPEFEEVTLNSLNVTYQVAVVPDLPHGYEMEPHPSWLALNEKFREALKAETSPEKQHEIFREMESFVDKYGEMQFPSIINEMSMEDYFTDSYFEWAYDQGIIDA